MGLFLYNPSNIPVLFLTESTSKMLYISFSDINPDVPYVPLLEYSKFLSLSTSVLSPSPIFIIMIIRKASAPPQITKPIIPEVPENNALKHSLIAGLGIAGDVLSPITPPAACHIL